VRAVLSSATHGRRVLARTDWEDSFALLEWLGRSGEARSRLARRLRAVIQQRRVAAGAAGGSGRRTVFETLFASEPLRAGVLEGARAARLGAIAAADGFRPLADTLRKAVAAGELDADDAARAVA
jgi:type II secretory ATPase GspE/PulE/Tfp pilus assembly ATPase PilB-like protein